MLLLLLSFPLCKLFLSLLFFGSPLRFCCLRLSLHLGSPLSFLRCCNSLSFFLLLGSLSLLFGHSLRLFLLCLLPFSRNLSRFLRVSFGYRTVLLTCNGTLDRGSWRPRWGRVVIWNIQAQPELQVPASLLLGHNRLALLDVEKLFNVVSFVWSKPGQIEQNFAKKIGIALRLCAPLLILGRAAQVHHRQRSKEISTWWSDSSHMVHSSWAALGSGTGSMNSWFLHPRQPVPGQYHALPACILGGAQQNCAHQEGSVPGFIGFVLSTCGCASPATLTRINIDGVGSRPLCGRMPSALTTLMKI